MLSRYWTIYNNNQSSIILGIVNFMKRISIILIALFPILFFCSCSKDDNVVDPNSPQGIKIALIGAWRTSMASSNWKIISIRPNGELKYDYVTKENLKEYTFNENTNTYYYSKDGYAWEYDPKSNAHWTYDESIQSISMYRDDGYYTFTYKVIMADDQKSWVGVDSKGNNYTFVKIEE